MEVTTLKATARKERGRNQIARLREQGRVPAIVYGPNSESESVSLDEVDIERELRHHHRVFRIDLDGKVEGVFLQDVQFTSSRTGRCTSTSSASTSTSRSASRSSCFYVGHPKGAAAGATLTKDHHTLQVDSLPHAVPENIEVGVSELDVGDSILAKDLALPPGVTLPDEEGVGDEVICHMAFAKTGADELAEADAEGDAGEAPAEGDEPKPDAPADGGGES